MATKTKRKPRPADTGGDRIALPPDTRAFLTPKQVISALQISIRKLREMVSTGAYPKPDVKDHPDLGRGVRWRVETHNRWCAEKLDPKG